MVRRGFVLSLLASAGGFLSSEAKDLPRAKHVPGSYVVEFEDSQVCPLNSSCRCAFLTVYDLNRILPNSSTALARRRRLAVSNASFFFQLSNY